MPTTTGIPLLDQVLAIVGALSVLTTAIAAILPKGSRVAQIAAKLGVDLKGVLVPATKPADAKADAK
jgi:hypothetical protein